jgi:hypothetical protein
VNHKRANCAGDVLDLRMKPPVDSMYAAAESRYGRPLTYRERVEASRKMISPGEAAVLLAAATLSAPAWAAEKIGYIAGKGLSAIQGGIDLTEGNR